MSRKGAYSCPVASGVIFAVNVDVRGDAGAPLGAYSQALLASIQAREACVAPCKQQGAQLALRSMCAQRMRMPWSNLSTPLKRKYVEFGSRTRGCLLSSGCR